MKKFLEKRNSAETFFIITEILFRKHSDYFFMETVKCEKGTILFGIF